jgi:hypothetical protein
MKDEIINADNAQNKYLNTIGNMLSKAGDRMYYGF